MKEVWKDIPGLEGLYQISNYGRLKSFHSDCGGRILAEYKNGKAASIATGVCHRNILQVANKTEYNPGLTRRQAGGFIWKFKQEKDVA